MKWARPPAKIAFILAAMFLCGDWIHGGIPCGVTKNIVSDFGADNSGLVDVTSSFTGTGSFRDFAINTYQPSNPGQLICLTIPSGRYFFGAGTFPLAMFDSIKLLRVDLLGSATITNALNVTGLTGSAAQAVLTFPGSIPSGIATGMGVIDDTNTAVLDGTLTVQSINAGAHTVTLNGNIASPGVSSGHTISFKGGGAALGTNGLTGVSSLTATVAAGASSVTLLTPAETSRFAVNTWAAMAGDVIQGGGSPINMFFHEFVFITGINAGTGQISFQSPLKFGYKSTWPGSGAATLYVIDPGWNATQVMNAGAYIGWDGPGNTLLNNNGRSITFNNASFPGAFASNISQNQSITFNNVSAPSAGFWEVDKMWEVATFNGGAVDGFQFFSGTANDTFTLSGTHSTQALLGSPGILNIVNSTLDGGIKPGATANGITTLISCTNSNLGSNGIFAYAGILDSLITDANGVTITTGGLITIPHSLENPIPWAVVGADMFLGNSTSSFVVPFSITDVSGDASNTFVQTTLSGYSSLPAAVNGVQAAVAKMINFSGCTGSTSVLDWSQAGARNARPATYSNRIYTCTNGIAAQQAAHPGVPVIDLNSPPTTDPLMTRALSSLTVAVSQADTGAAVALHIGGQFDNGQVFNGSLVGSTWAPVVDLKTTGTRTYTGSSNTWTGSAGADSLTTTTPGFPSYLGTQGAFRPFTSRDVSGEAANACPIVTFTVQTQ